MVDIDTNGCFDRASRDTAEQMQRANRDAWGRHAPAGRLPLRIEGETAMNRQGKDETVALRRIIVDCVQSQYRCLVDPADVDPHAFGDRLACDVLDRLRSAEINVVSRWARTHEGTEMKERIPPGKAADICGISRDTLIRLAKRGMVPGATRLTERLWRFDERRLRKWVREGEKTECQQPVFTRGTARGGAALELGSENIDEAYERALNSRRSTDRNRF
jgi:hypothetical protein